MADPDYLVELKQLMQNPTNIRNICTSAHIHHGKCISGNSRLILADGGVVRAKDFYAIAATQGKKFEETGEHTIYDMSQCNIFVPSLNRETGRFEKKKIELAWKLLGGNVIEVTLENGNTIRTTPEHKFLLLEENDFVEREAALLNIGDRIVCPRNLWEMNDKNYHHLTLPMQEISGMVKKPLVSA